MIARRALCVNTMSLVIVTFLIILKSSVVDSYVTAQGIVPLDEITFEKVLCHHSVCVVNFHEKYAYGEAETEFQKVAQLTSNSPDILIAEIGTSDWGVTENHSIREKYNISTKDYPAILLFFKGNLHAPLKFKGTVTADHILLWIQMESHINLGDEPSLFKVQIVMKGFLEATGSAESPETKLDSLIEKAETINSEIRLESDKILGNIYINIMKKVKTKGMSYIDTERSRVGRLVEKEKLSESKKMKFQRKIDALVFCKDLVKKIKG